MTIKVYPDAEIKADVKLVIPSEDGSVQVQTFKLDNLPPFVFEVILPEHYPLKSPPLLKFQGVFYWCFYEELAEKMTKMWEESKSMILYEWWDFLKSTFLESMREDNNDKDEFLLHIGLNSREVLDEVIQ